MRRLARPMPPVTIGYQINVVGFGWTNAAYLEFLVSASRGQAG